MLKPLMYPASHALTKSAGQMVTCSWDVRNTGTAPGQVLLQIGQVTNAVYIAGGLYNVGAGQTITTQIAVFVSLDPPTASNMQLVPGINQMVFQVYEDIGATNELRASHNFTINFTTVGGGPIIGAVGDPTIV